MVLVCAKCEKKIGGGFGKDGRKPLSKLLRKRAEGNGRKASFGLLSTKCLKICPRSAVTVVNGTRPRDWLIVSAGTAVEDVIATLGLEQRLPEGETTRLSPR
jgi:predicted metal-binding protein